VPGTVWVVELRSTTCARQEFLTLIFLCTKMGISVLMLGERTSVWVDW